MRNWRLLRLLGLLLVGHQAAAQQVIEGREILEEDRPEAWAMNTMAGTTLMSSFGPSPALERGQWQAGVELGSIPWLSAAERRVGFNGFKSEDLNKSPVFGRARLSLGLPAGLVAEIGYTPPVSIGGARSRDLMALAVGRRFVQRTRWSLSGRLFGQHGFIDGDITCPSELAGEIDVGLNPFDCRAASRDRVSLNYYGVDLTAGWQQATWQWHAGIGWMRTELGVQVDAVTGSFRDRTRLTANGSRAFLTLGAGRRLRGSWSLGLELLHMPMPVKRDLDASSVNDPLNSLRLALRWSGTAGRWQPQRTGESQE